MLPQLVDPDDIPEYYQYFVKVNKQVKSLSRSYDNDYLVRSAKAAICSLSAGMKLSNIKCPSCQADHLDEGDYAIKPHVLHTCEYCKEKFKFTRNTMGNPLA